MRREMLLFEVQQYSFHSRQMLTGFTSVATLTLLGPRRGHDGRLFSLVDVYHSSFLLRFHFSRAAQRVPKHNTCTLMEPLPRGLKGEMRGGDRCHPLVPGRDSVTSRGCHGYSHLTVVLVSDDAVEPCEGVLKGPDLW